MREDHPRYPRGPWPLLIAGCLMIGNGCGGTPAPETADADAAKRLLVRVLDSWQKGETPDALKDASPSVVAWDPRWEKGIRLEKYEVQDSGTPSAAERKFRVALWLRDDTDKAKDDTDEAKREDANFKVGTAPVPTVLRALFD